MSWRSLSRVFPWHKSRTNEAALRKTQAYMAVFSGKAARDDAELVLADLANYSGFYRVSPADTPDATLRFQEGMRAVYGYIYSHLNLSASDISALENAARQEAAVDQQLAG